MGDSIPNAPGRKAGGILDFRHAAASLAKAALSLSEAAQAMSSAAEALSIAIPSAEEFRKYSCVCSNQSIIRGETAVPQRETTDHDLGEQIGPERQASDCEGPNTEHHFNAQEHSFPDDDYYMSDQDEDYIHALLKQQKGENIDRIVYVTAPAPTSTDYASCSVDAQLPGQSSAPPSVAPDSATDPTTQPSSSFNRRHILVENEADIFLTISALSQRYNKVFCYMQYPLPSLALYQKIIKDITKLFVFVMANWSSNSLPQVFDKQKRAIMLFHETFKIPPPLSEEANNFCIVHVGWPRNAERYLSQTACREAAQSVLIACSDEQSIYPSCSKILSSTIPWPDQDYKLLQTYAETLRPRLDVSLGSVLPEVKEKAYMDWIGAYGQGGQRHVASWTPSALVKRANIYALDTLQYGNQQPRPATGHVAQRPLPLVSIQFVKQNKLEPAVREGLLRVIPGSPGLDSMLSQFPSGGNADKQQTTSLPSHKQESKTPPTATSQSLQPHLQRYLFHEDECDIVPLLCCLAKQMGQKNTICFVKVIFAWKAIAPLISEVVSKPVFVVSTPKLSPEIISKIDQASESPTGCLVFCNILEPLTEQLRNKAFSKSIHIGWVDRGSQYQDQTRMSGLSSSFVILSKSDPPTAPQEIETEGLWQRTPAPEDELIACYEKWKEQLALTPRKPLRQCYMEWILFHHSGLHKVVDWSAVQLVTHANEFARNVLLHGENQPASPMLVGGTLSVTPGFVRQWGLQAAVDAKVLRVE